ncbi:MAG: cupin-like domain-containing protein [Rickettsiales bacterium]|nr:cupin-like domain-containing protein [Rickettsiales bacterium]
MAKKRKMDVCMLTVDTGMSHKLCKENSMGDIYRVNFNEDSRGIISRLISIRRPFIICNLMKSWPATYKWNLEYLEEHVGDNLINYVETDINNVTAYEKILQMKMSDFLKRLAKAVHKEHINENIYLVVSKIMSHFNRRSPILPNLLKDINIPNFIPYERLWEINLWMGIGGNRSNLHFDPEENLLSIVQGSKKVVLFAPNQSRFLYQNKKSTTNLLHSTVNIFDFDEEKFPLIKKSKYYETEVKQGETLYLPSGWWHAVESSNELNIAVNLWWLIEGYRLLNFSNYLTKQIFAIKGKWLSVLFPKKLRT